MSATRSSAQPVMVPRLTLEQMRNMIGVSLMREEENLERAASDQDELRAIGQIIGELVRLDGELEDLANA